MDKKGIAGIVICTILLLVWMPLMDYLGFLPKPQPATQPAPEAVADTTDTAAVHAETGAQTDAPAVPAAAVAQDDAPPPPAAAPVLTPSPAAENAPAPAAAAAPAVPDANQELLELRNDGAVSVMLDPAGGGVRSVHLRKYLDDDRLNPVVIGTPKLQFCALLPPAGMAFDPLATRVLAHTANELRLQRRLASGGLVVNERWSLLPDTEYRLAYEVSFVNPGGEVQTLDGWQVAAGSASDADLSKRRQAMAGGFELGVDVQFADAKNPKEYVLKEIKKNHPPEAAAISRAFTWLAVHNKYFLFFLQPRDEAFGSLRLDAGSLDEKTSWAGARLDLRKLTLAPGETGVVALDCYAGPKEFAQLKAMGNGLESILRLDVFFWGRPGWMGAISRLILRSLLAINQKVASPWGYGIAIVIVTFVIKMLFWPLTHKSTVSMRKMQKLQPLLKEIQTQYKGQTQKIHEKTVALYREHQVNPLGGCLPILFQIPVFFALFNTLRSAIELRQAEFLWVADLSMPDDVANLFGLPIRPLAILMGATMFIQQKMTPSSPDPAQARMMNFMTLFFMVLFYSMPAGLTLYWTMNQVLTIVQTYFTRKLEKNNEAPVVKA